MSSSLVEAKAGPSQVEEVCRAGLLEAFRIIEDPRDPRGCRYELAPLLAFTVVALLAGCTNVSQIFHFGCVQPDLLKALGFRPTKRCYLSGRRGVIFSPNEGTIALALSRISGEQVNLALGGWLGRMLAQRVTASIDGKALRGSKGFVLSVFVDEVGQVVWQEDVGEKANELSTLKRVLSQILKAFPQLALLTGDAAFCHKTIARGIAEAGRDYFLQLKSPHETDVGIAADAFSQITAAREPLATTVEKRAVSAAAKSSGARSGGRPR